jgi:hypothetical protein
MKRMTPLIGADASHNWWKSDLAISYILLPSKSILESLSGDGQHSLSG